MKDAKGHGSDSRGGSVATPARKANAQRAAALQQSQYWGTSSINTSRAALQANERARDAAAPITALGIAAQHGIPTAHLRSDVLTKQIAFHDAGVAAGMKPTPAQAAWRGKFK